jgi:hypothetical protein
MTAVLGNEAKVGQRTGQQGAQILLCNISHSGQVVSVGTGKGGSHHFYNFFCGSSFGYKVIGPVLESGLPVLGGIVNGKNADHKPRVLGLNPSREIQPIFVRQRDIDKHQIRSFDLLQGLSAVIGLPEFHRGKLLAQ